MRANVLWLAFFAVLVWNVGARAQTDASAASASAAAVQSPPKPLPAAEVFFNAPDIQSAKLSPSGRWLAMTTGIGSARVRLIVFDLQQWKLHAQLAHYTDADIYQFAWVGDERLVYTLADLQSSARPIWWPGLYSVQRDGTNERQLVKIESPFFVSKERFTREPLSPRHRLLHVPDLQDEDVIVAEHTYTAAGEPVGTIAKRLNVVTGRATSLSLGAPGPARDWLFDPAGEPRLVTTFKEGRTTVHWRAPGQAGWRVLSEHPQHEAPFLPEYVEAKGVLYVTMPHPRTGHRVLTTFDFQTGKPSPDYKVSAPGFDFNGHLVAEVDGGVALGVRQEVDAETTVWFDPRMKTLQEKADRQLPGRVNRITCKRCDQPDMTALIWSWSDRHPGQFWIYTAANDGWRKVGDVRSRVDAQNMAHKGFARFAARDGMEIPVWITTPPGPHQPRPTVVLVHGGPWVRGGHWQWEAHAQFLASRGYTVIEPEFRGSTGYGWKHFRAGWKQWGLSMQDDVADALAWAVKAGHTDAKRVCIAGASYGGYATLMGLVRHPELYRCGVAWAAVTDPRLMFRWIHGTDQSDEVRAYSLPTLMGDPEKDAAQLEATSPVAQASRIRAPLLLAIGGRDARVPPVHGYQLRDALQAAGRPPTWIEYPDEGHGWYYPQNRADFARRLEAFLAEHLR